MTESDARELALQRSESGYYSDQHEPPPRDGLDAHQVWAWMGGAPEPHWEIKGTGFVWEEGRPKPLRDALAEIGDVKIKFWVCPDHPHGTVAWIGRVAACREVGCERTSQ